MKAYLFDKAPTNAVIKIPEGIVELPKINIRGSDSWTSVKKFKLPSTVNSIPEWFFVESGIEELTLPINIEFAENAIRDCEGIKTVKFLNKKGEVFTTKSVYNGINSETDLITIIDTIKKQH